MVHQNGDAHLATSAVWRGQHILRSQGQFHRLPGLIRRSEHLSEEISQWGLGGLSSGPRRWRRDIGTLASGIRAFVNSLFCHARDSARRHRGLVDLAGQRWLRVNPSHSQQKCDQQQKPSDNSASSLLNRRINPCHQFLVPMFHYSHFLNIFTRGNPHEVPQGGSHRATPSDAQANPTSRYDTGKRQSNQNKMRGLIGGG